MDAGNETVKRQIKQTITDMMKKVLTMAAVLTLAASSMMAQNTFKGIVKYKIESTGTTAMNLPPEIATAEIKVMGEQMYKKLYVYEGGEHNHAAQKPEELKF